MRDDGQPQGHEDDDDLSGGDDSFPETSLSDDLHDLFEDGRVYVEAELAFQKSRLALAGDHGKKGIFYAICAFAVLHLALVALVIGAIFALAPLITALGATALVVGLLLLAGGILAMKAKARFESLSDTYSETEE